MTLEEIKEQVAYEYEWIDWICFLSDCPDHEKDVVIDEVAERYAQSKTETIKHLAGINSELKKQIQELTAWKESASKVFKNLDLQAIGKTLGIGLGEDVSTNVLPRVKDLIEQNRELIANIQFLLQSLDYDALGAQTELIIDDLKELLTKYQKS